MGDKFNLVTTFHEEASRDRCEDFLFCLDKNLENNLIKKVFIFLEYSTDPLAINKQMHNKLKKDPRVRIKKIKDRPTFYDFFSFCNTLKDELCIVCNGDIYFPKEDQQNLKLLSNQDYNKNCFVLTRYNLAKETKNGGLKKNFFGTIIKTNHKRGGSIDSWIFRAPIRIDKMNLDIELGRPECDPSMSHELTKIKKVINPCLTVVSIHKHKNWTNKAYRKINYQSKTFTRPEWRELLTKQKFNWQKRIPFSSIIND
jgi:hypothetical protein